MGAGKGYYHALLDDGPAPTVTGADIANGLAAFLCDAVHATGTQEQRTALIQCNYQDYIDYNSSETGLSPWDDDLFYSLTSEQIYYADNYQSPDSPFRLGYGASSGYHWFANGFPQGPGAGSPPPQPARMAGGITAATNDTDAAEYTITLPYTSGSISGLKLSGRSGANTVSVLGMPFAGNWQASFFRRLRVRINYQGGGLAGYFTGTREYYYLNAAGGQDYSSPVVRQPCPFAVGFNWAASVDPANSQNLLIQMTPAMGVDHVVTHGYNRTNLLGFYFSLSMRSGTPFVGPLHGGGIQAQDTLDKFVWPTLLTDLSPINYSVGAYIYTIPPPAGCTVSTEQAFGFWSKTLTYYPFTTSLDLTKPYHGSGFSGSFPIRDICAIPQEVVIRVRPSHRTDSQPGTDTSGGATSFLTTYGCRWLWGAYQDVTFTIPPCAGYGVTLASGTEHSSAVNAANLAAPTAHYQRVAALTGLDSMGTFTGAKGIAFWRSVAAAPRLLTGSGPPAIFDTGPVAVTTGSGDKNPRLAVDSRNLLLTVFENAQGVWLTQSSDDGDSWGATSMAIPNGKHPAITQRDGALLLMAVTGSDVVGYHLQSQYRANGDLLFSAPAIVTDTAGAPLAVANDSFGITAAMEGPARWVMAVLIAGEAATSEWWSADEGRTFTRIAAS